MAQFLPKKFFHPEPAPPQGQNRIIIFAVILLLIIGAAVGLRGYGRIGDEGAQAAVDVDEPIDIGVEAPKAAPDVGEGSPEAEEGAEPDQVERFHGYLAAEKDYTALEQTPGYNHLLGWLKKHSTAQMAKLCAEDDAPYDLYFNRPRSNRGRLVRAEGVVVSLTSYGIDTNPSGVEYVFEGVLLDTRTNRAWRFQVLERPKERIVPMQDIAHVDGVFLKVNRFVNTQGQERFVPFIVGRSLTKVAPTPQKTLGEMETILLFAGGAAGLFLVLGLILSQRSQRRADEQRRLLQRRHRTLDPRPSPRTPAKEEAPSDGTPPGPEPEAGPDPRPPA